MAVQHRLKRDNIFRILGSLWRFPGQSRADLARELRLDRSTVGSLADWMIQNKMLEENSANSSRPRGGRPPVLLNIRSGYSYAIGVELTVPSIRLYAADLSGQYLDEKDIPIDVYGPGAINSLAVELARFRKTIEEKYPMLAGLATVGLGVSGSVDNAKQEITLSYALQIFDPLSVSEPLETVLNVPIVLFNDAQACALGEANKLRKKDLILVLIEKRSACAHRDIGVGIGVIHNDEIMHGRAITHLLQPAEGQEDRDNHLFIHNLGRSLALIANVTGCNDIVLGGDVDDYRDELCQKITANISKESNFNGGEAVMNIHNSSDPDWAVAAGAQHSAIRQILQERSFNIKSL
ncbi:MULTISPECIES: ROK family transcriptional regulator [unclassified Oceanispirochaeta]|uniref:ROK family transcriptional regulator n=1 Tax=unclassified Oceanispirochaeta TaxID=2635722 RepID=UPI000E092E4D|nr:MULTISPECIES: ROK family transcriptional regulator [unclassified Oceanispirochaeta]MBF9017561.1 ROK family transcriptional regulator [Oceanispirochaeta sp. M2]NPD74133.1 ROK family transcriptional regulator [Oceanispirochaeta sp. M1]RDG30054.1 ROK family transcriptional regulator [Oceanispirochaeta sp. M1]